MSSKHPQSRHNSQQQPQQLRLDANMHMQKKWTEQSVPKAARKFNSSALQISKSMHWGRQQVLRGKNTKTNFTYGQDCNHNLCGNFPSSAKTRCTACHSLISKFTLKYVALCCVCVSFFHLSTQNNQHRKRTKRPERTCLSLTRLVHSVGFCMPMTPALCEIWIINQEQNIPCARKKEKEKKQRWPT